MTSVGERHPPFDDGAASRGGTSGEASTQPFRALLQVAQAAAQSGGFRQSASVVYDAEKEAGFRPYVDQNIDA